MSKVFNEIMSLTIGDTVRSSNALELFVLIVSIIGFIFGLCCFIWGLREWKRTNYLVNKSFLRMEERCVKRLDKETKITVRNHYVTNYIFDIDD